VRRLEWKVQAESDLFDMLECRQETDFFVRQRAGLAALAARSGLKLPFATRLLACQT
jgi:hypothetical protein